MPETLLTCQQISLLYTKQYTSNSGLSDCYILHYSLIPSIQQTRFDLSKVGNTHSCCKYEDSGPLLAYCGIISNLLQYTTELDPGAWGKVDVLRLGLHRPIKAPG